MGLRQLYFLIGGLLKAWSTCRVGLSIILGFIGIKLILHALHSYHLADWAPYDGEIPIWLSLTVIVVTLTITTVASLIKSKYDEDQLATRSESQEIRQPPESDSRPRQAQSPERPTPPHRSSE
jgi:tellurite resistance protein TerC